MGMKRYILLIGIIVMPLSLLSNSNQVTGSLNDLMKALQQLSKRLSGGGQSVPAWVQQLQALEQQMDQIVQSGAAGCNQVGSFYLLSADYAKLIETSGPGVITQYKQNYNKYSLLPYTFEMDCILAEINPLININQNVTPLLQDYEAVYGSYTKKLSGLRVLPDQKYPNELKRVRTYVYQYKPTSTGTPPPSSSQVTPPPPPSFPTGTSSSQGTTPPPPPPPMPTGPTKIPTSSQSGSQPAPTTTGSKPTGTRPPLSFLGDITSGTGKLRPTETSGKPKPSQQQGGIFDALKNLIGLGVPQVIQQEEDEDSDWEEEGEATSTGPSADFIAKTKKDYALTQDKDARRQINQQRVAAGLNELPAGYQAGEEQQIRDKFDNDTKKDFLNPSPGIRNKINADRRKAGLSELPAGYYSGEQERMRENIDFETKTQILDASDKSDPQEKEGLLKIAAGDRRKFGLSAAKNDTEAVREAEQYALAFNNFKQQMKLTKAVSSVDQAVHDETVRRWFVVKDVYKDQQDELQRLLNDINQERSASNLPSLKQ
jgi:hypothetical protein